jgi:2-amino-4-hydroxy-6-hydroxymethyldihydropteridine diphosphokinase
MNTCYLLLGTNLGNRKNNFFLALALLEKNAGKVSKTSGIYETEPWGFNSDQWFYNIAVELNTEFAPENLLAILLQTEKIMGRERINKETYENRIIDIDILIYENQIIKNEYLEIPHPRLHLRKFALSPLIEIASDIIHPVFKKKMKQLLIECKDESNISNIGHLHNAPPYSQ